MVDVDSLKFDAQGLIPTIIQSIAGDVRMLGYCSRESLAKTAATGLVTFFSRSKNRLWTKGEESGRTLEVVSMHVDCDGDALLVIAKPNGPTCHTGFASCFEHGETRAPRPTETLAWLC